MTQRPRPIPGGKKRAIVHSRADRRYVITVLTAIRDRKGGFCANGQHQPRPRIDSAVCASEELVLKTGFLRQRR